MLSQSKPKVLFGPWFELLDKPFVGITSDGIVRKDIYTLGDDGAPTKQMVSTGQFLILELTNESFRT